MKEKIPLFCQIKRLFAIPSPSASIYCKYGYRYRPEHSCKKCPNSYGRAYKSIWMEEYTNDRNN